MVLSWSYPSLTTAGATLDRVDRIVVYRMREELPPSLLGESSTDVNTAAGAGVRDPIALFERVPPVSPERFETLAEVAGVLTREQIPSFTAGATIVLEDRPRLRAESGLPLRYTYGVTATRGNVESDPSNLVSIVPLDVPLPPENVQVEAQPAGVVLRWEPPARTILGEEAPSAAGYNVYRLPLTGGSILTATPLNERPIEGAEFVDTPPYGDWRYAVTTAVGSESRSHESQFSLLATARFVDLQPPPVPTDVSLLVEDRRIRVIWTGVDAADLAGYKVFRHIPLEGYDREVLTPTPITNTTYIDDTPVPGLGYYYGVASVDRSGNMSELAVAGEVLIPK